MTIESTSSPSSLFPATADDRVHVPASLGPPEIDRPQLRADIERTTENLADFLPAPGELSTDAVPGAAAEVTTGSAEGAENPSETVADTAPGGVASLMAARRGGAVLAAAAGAAVVAFWLRWRSRPFS